MCLRTMVFVTVRHTNAVTVLFNLHLFHLKIEIELTEFKLSLLGEKSSQWCSLTASPLIQADQKRNTTKQQFLIYKAISCSLQKSMTRGQSRATAKYIVLHARKDNISKKQASLLFL